MASLRPFQRGLSLHTAAGSLYCPPQPPLCSSGSSPVLCLCSVVLEGRTGGPGFYSVNTLFKDILFYRRLHGPSAACTRSLLYTFNQHFFRLKAGADAAAMRYVASYLLAALGGNSSPSAKDIKKILDSVGIEADDDRLNKVISELNGKNIEDVIAQGIGKLASVPAGGAVAVSAAPGSAAPAAGSAPAAAEEKKDEKKEESEESDDDMGFGLFD